MWHTKKTAIIALTFFIMTSTSNGRYLDSESKALEVIADFATKICGSIPIEGKSENIELSGEAKAELNNVVKTIADLGIKGAAKYQDNEYKGLLQSDLSKALGDSKDCKLKIWSDLKDKFLSTTAEKTDSRPVKLKFSVVLKDNVNEDGACANPLAAGAGIFVKKGKCEWDPTWTGDDPAPDIELIFNKNYDEPSVCIRNSRNCTLEKTLENNMDYSLEIIDKDTGGRSESVSKFSFRVDEKLHKKVQFGKKGEISINAI